jgi:hypothetical protein
LDISTIRLRPRSDCSFDLVAGRPADLALWLKDRGFSITTYITPPQHHRLEREAPARERAIVLIFKSGTTLCQGAAGPREETIALLRSLVVEEQPEAAQGVLL